MNLLSVPLATSPEQEARLQELQRAFSRACNALAPVVAQQRCWNRVALHHLTYRTLREQFPELGSQMVCNAIYSVCRAARLVYQHPQSPFFVGRGGAPVQPLPRLVFTPEAPVYFDRHTLSIKEGRLSMFTLDGRMHFDLSLEPQQAELFATRRLCEVVLHGHAAAGWRLSFAFDAKPEAHGVPDGLLHAAGAPSQPVSRPSSQPASPPPAPGGDGGQTAAAAGAGAGEETAPAPVLPRLELPPYLSLQP